MWWWVGLSAEDGQYQWVEGGGELQDSGWWRDGGGNVREAVEGVLQFAEAKTLTNMPGLDKLRTDLDHKARLVIKMIDLDASANYGDVAGLKWSSAFNLKRYPTLPRRRLVLSGASSRGSSL